MTSFLDQLAYKYGNYLKKNDLKKDLTKTFFLNLFYVFFIVYPLELQYVQANIT